MTTIEELDQRIEVNAKTVEDLLVLPVGGMTLSQLRDSLNDLERLSKQLALDITHLDDLKEIEDNNSKLGDF